MRPALWPQYPLDTAFACGPVLQLGIAVLCLFSRKRGLSLWLLLWLALNLIVYRIGLATEGWRYPYSCLGPVMNALNLSPLRADIFMGAMCFSLIAGSVTLLWLGHKRDLAERFQKMASRLVAGTSDFPFQTSAGRQPVHTAKRTSRCANRKISRCLVSFAGVTSNFPPMPSGKRCPVRTAKGTSL
jgi:hypothetical protein